jgi:hypothetical protein
VSNTGNVEDSYTARIVGTTGGIIAKLIGLDGLPTQSIPVFRLPALSQGTIAVQVDLSAIGTGMVNVVVQSLTNSGLSSTAVATITAGFPVGIVIGPKIVALNRYGVHWMPTTLVLTFDQPPDPETASDTRNYVIVDPHGHVVSIRTAVYDDATKTVTLHPARRLNIHLKYRLTVNGTTSSAISNAAGQLLDGDADGISGGNYRTVISRTNLVYGKKTPRPILTVVKPNAKHVTDAPKQHKVRPTQVKLLRVSGVPKL